MSFYGRVFPGASESFNSVAVRVIRVNMVLGGSGYLKDILKSGCDILVGTVGITT